LTRTPGGLAVVEMVAGLVFEDLQRMTGAPLARIGADR
jgi:hypothetical protein